MTTAAQDYLKAIHALEAEGGGAPVPTNALALRLAVSAASATSMLKKLDSMGLVAHVPYRGAALTRAGRKVALEVVRHHRLLETYLSEALGVPWDAIHAEAEVLEHVLSEDLEDRIAARLGHPTSDPHGHPIPGKDGSMPDSPRRPLWDGSDGERLEIRGVPDDDPVVLRYLGEIGLKPGTSVEVTGRGPRGGPLFVRVAKGKTHALSRDLAEALWVG